MKSPANNQKILTRKFVKFKAKQHRLEQSYNRFLCFSIQDWCLIKEIHQIFFSGLHTYVDSGSVYRAYQNALTGFKIQLYRTKKKYINKYISKLVVSEFNWNVIFNNKYFYYVRFYLQLTQDIYHTRHHFNNCGAVTVYQDTVHNKCSKCLSSDSEQARIRLVKEFCTRSNVRRSL